MNWQSNTQAKRCCCWRTKQSTGRSSARCWWLTCISARPQATARCISPCRVAPLKRPWLGSTNCWRDMHATGSWCWGIFYTPEPRAPSARWQRLQHGVHGIASLRSCWCVATTTGMRATRPPSWVSPCMRSLGCSAHLRCATNLSHTQAMPYWRATCTLPMCCAAAQHIGRVHVARQYGMACVWLRFVAQRKWAEQPRLLMHGDTQLGGRVARMPVVVATHQHDLKLAMPCTPCCKRCQRADGARGSGV